MEDDITIGVTEIVNNIEVTAQPNDQIIDIDVIDNSDSVTLNVTPNIIEVNIERGSSFARWGTIYGSILDQTDLQNALFNKADLVNGLVPAYQLPSFVDDVIEVANFASLPTTGETGKLYLTLDNNKIYRWGGSTYVEIASNQAIWGAITGTLTNQTDLVNALNLKADKTITITPNAPLTGGGDLSANRSISINQSGAFSDGFLSSTDWNTFNNKQNQLNGTGFVKASGTTISYDNTSYLPLSGGTMTGNLFLRANNDVGGTNYCIGQTMATNDEWKIYGNTIALDRGELVFELGDNGSASSVIGQRFRFFYNNSSSGTAKSPFILDYNDAVFDANVTATSFVVSGGTSSQFLRADGSVSTTVITGSGTLDYLPKFTASGVIGNSSIIDIGTQVSVLSNLLQVNGAIEIFRGFNSRYNGSNTYLQGAFLRLANQSNQNGYSLQLNSSNGLDFWSAGSTNNIRMTLTAAGNVGIGTTSPLEALEVIKSTAYTTIYTGANGNGASGLACSSDNRTNTWFVGSRKDSIGGASGTDRFNILYNTNSILTATTGGNVVVNNLGTGLVYSNAGALTSTNPSDERLKDDITNLQYGLNEILQLRPVSYNWKNDTINQGKQFGFIAQEVQEVMPELISEFTTTEDEEEVIRLGLDKEGIYATLVNAIKELKAEIDLLKQKA